MSLVRENQCQVNCCSLLRWSFLNEDFSLHIASIQYKRKSRIYVRTVWCSMPLTVSAGLSYISLQLVIK